jgi:hypothetical protein
MPPNARLTKSSLMPRTTRRGNAVAALLAGAAWIPYAVLANAAPEGCVGDACLTGTMRDTGALDLLLLAGLLLFAGAMGGLAIRARTLAGSGLLTTGAIIAATGTAGLTIGLTVATIVVSDDLAWWALAFPGFLGIAAGFALSGVGIMRVGALPQPLGALIAVGALALLAFNDQDARVLLILPLGVTALVLGIVELSRSSPTHSPTRDPLIGSPLHQEKPGGRRT